MKSFDDFWNEVAVPELDPVIDKIADVGHEAESTADVFAFILVSYSRKLLECYHSWLLQNVLDQPHD